MNMKLDRKKNGEPKDRQGPATTWRSTMEYAFVFARKCGLVRYVYSQGGGYIITDDMPDEVPYYTMDPLGVWTKVTETGQLELPTLRK